MLSHRTFGVEIECGHDSYNWDAVARHMRENGFSATTRHVDRDYKKAYAVGSDGSGIEVRSPILKGESGYKEVFRIMDYLTELGCWVTRSDGMHVHIGAKQFFRDEQACTALARTWYANQGAIGRMCSSHRRTSASCVPIAEAEVDKLGKVVEVDDLQFVAAHNGGQPFGRYEKIGTKKEKHWGGRKSLNFSSLEEHGTIEFRLHEGCLDPTKAVAWIKFCQKLIDYTARERTVISCARSKSALLTTLSVPRDAVAILARKQPTMPTETVYERRARMRARL